MKANRVLILGNSITSHTPKADIGWLDNWGMAASSQEKDFVHLLLNNIAEYNHGQKTEALINNIAAFEKEYSNYDIKSALAQYADFNPDIIVLAIGENIPQPDTQKKKDALRKALSILLEGLRNNGNPVIFIRSSFYADETKDGILREISDKFNAEFVDIGSLCHDERNFARAERTFTNKFVAAHPGDRGMAAIASTIWKKMTKYTGAVLTSARNAQ